MLFWNKVVKGTVGFLCVTALEHSGFFVAWIRILRLAFFFLQTDLIPTGPFTISEPQNQEIGEF